MNNQRRTSLIYLAIILFIGIFFWSGIFRLQGNSSSHDRLSSGYTDKLSGEKVTKEQINNITHTNPRAAYFVAFDKLTYYGVSSDDVRYLEDFITNYCLYTKNANAPIVSLVDGSFKGPFIESEGFVTKYSFDFGIDGEDVHTVSVISNSNDPSIDIGIRENNTVVAHRKFKVYY